MQCLAKTTPQTLARCTLRETTCRGSHESISRMRRRVRMWRSNDDKNGLFGMAKALLDNREGRDSEKHPRGSLRSEFHRDVCFSQVSFCLPFFFLPGPALFFFCRVSFAFAVLGSFFYKKKTGSSFFFLPGHFFCRVRFFRSRIKFFDLGRSVLPAGVVTS